MEKAPKPALFVHIQKTAGSSIVDLAMHSYETVWGRFALRASTYIEPVFRYRKFNMIRHGGYIDHHPEDFEQIGFISGHFGYDFAKHFMPSRYSFVFLRDPVERILSFYYYCRNRGSYRYPVHRLARKLELDQFLIMGIEDPQIRTRIWNHQTWQLAHGWGCRDQKGIDDFNPGELLDLAMTHLQEFSHVGFTETFENDRDIICRALGWPVPERRVVSNVGVERPGMAELVPSTIHLLGELTQLDQMLYNQAWSYRNS